MFPVALAISPLWRLAGYALLAAGIFGAGVYAEHGRMQKKLDAKTSEFDQFKGGVAAIGAEAARRTALTDATNHRNKERTDEENRKRAAALTAATARLRHERDDARSRVLSEAGRTPGCPDGQVCLDRAEFGRAYGELLRGVRAVVDEGDKVRVDLESARDWARGLQQTPR